ncbi:MAG: electron transfer flavoprotein subunit beta/FixA family protein [Stomatobaculum sp.]|nr:electron transfer flavoprotein subunit beta/FixA family protein [Stomatobaculum sp.]
MNKAENFRIAVCVKQVPAGAQAKLDPVTKTLVRSAGASILNPYDSFAVEAALQIRDTLDLRAKEEPADDAGSAGNPQAPENTVIAISMGIPSTEKLLRDLVARGVDEGVLLTDRAFAGADTIATASTLAMGIRETEYARGKISLIICGHMAVDGDTAQIGPELAETLNLPHVSNVLKITEVDPKERYIVVECIAAEGRQTLKVSLPALLTVSKDINVLRLPSIAGIRNADQAEIRLLTAADLNADPERIGKAGSATQVVRTFTPAFNGGAERITGTSKEAASKIREIIGRIL